MLRHASFVTARVSIPLLLAFCIAGADGIRPGPNVGAASASDLPKSRSAADASRPNIILLVSDDQAWGGLSVPMHPTLAGASSSRIQTPNLARLATQGMRFSDAYAPAPVCSPSRISIQTGKSPATLQWTKAAQSVTAADGYPLVPPKSIRAIPTRELTIGELLGAQGYATAHFGKWHLSGGGPGAHGYDVHDGDTGNNDAAPFVDPNPGDVFGVAERARKFMADAKEDGRPFFLQVSYYPLHYPENARPATLERLRARGTWRNEKELQRAAITEDLDEGVGRLLDVIDELQLTSNTYVIYTSDNGQSSPDNAGQKDRARQNAERLTGGKGGLSEGGIRVPFLLRGPGVPADAWCAAPIVGFDLLPTFADWAGALDAVPKDVEGVSFAALARDPAQVLARPEPGLVFHFPHYQGQARPESALRRGTLKVCLDYETGAVALYDLARDPGEATDLAPERPEEAKALREALVAHLKRLGAQLPVPNPQAKGEAAGPTDDRRARRRNGEREPRRDRSNDQEPDTDGRDAAPASGDRRDGGEDPDRVSEAPPEARPFLAFPGVEVRWDDDFLYVASDGLPSHPMMVGIRAWNQQVPLPQRFTGENVFRIPRRPKLLDEPIPTVLEGPIALAVNGVPIFHPTTQGGRHDAFEHGELDTFGGHAGRADDYHYHTAPLHLMEVVGPDEPIAYGLDGIPLYGTVEADGSAVVALDSAHGHRHGDGPYHYHGSLDKPYTLGAFRGAVDLEARPETQGWRPFTTPLRGATITDFQGDPRAREGAALEYSRNNRTYRIEYRINAEGGVEFRFIAPDGTVREESHPAPRPAGARSGGARSGGARSGGERPGGERPGGERPGGTRRGERAPDRPSGASEAPREPWLTVHSAELDRDGDGQLTRAELRSEVVRALAGFDQDSNGRITPEELTQGARVRSAVAGFLREHRAELDTDGDGALTLGEVQPTFERFFDAATRGAEGDVLHVERRGAAPAPRAERDAPRSSSRADSAASPDIPRRSPSFVVVLVDDMGWDDVGFMGNRGIATPRLDALAAQGVVFDAAYANAPNCAPTRASLLSGMWPGRHGVYTVVDDRNDPGSAHHRLLAAESAAELAPATETFAEALREGGYATGFFGMWNLGRGAAAPREQGFDVAVVPRDLGFATNAYQDDKGRRLPDELTARALQFIVANKSRPSLCYLALHSVHAPFDPDPGLLAKYKSAALERGDSAEFAATVEGVDRCIGGLVDGLKVQGLLDSTILFFMSDNGGERGRTAPLAGGKGELYEGGLRVPFFVVGAGVSGGRRIDEPVVSLDLYPTLLEQAGLSPRPNLDGVSLAALLAGGPAPERDALYWHFPCYTGQGTPASAMRSGNWKLVRRYEAEAPELYDLAADPRETSDLRVTRPELAASLDARLTAWLRETGAALPRGPNPAFDPNARRGSGGPGKGGSREERRKKE